MRGVDGAKTAVLAWLGEEVPRRWDEDAVGPRPKSYTGWELERLNPDQVPAVEVAGLDTPVTFVRRREAEDLGTPVYEVGYRLRVFLTVRGASFEQTTHRRDRGIAVVTEALLARLTLGTDWATVNDSTVRQEFSATFKVRAEDAASIAAAYVEAVVNVVETIDLAPLVPAGGIDDVTVIESPLA